MTREFCIRLCCGACGNQTVVNLLGFTAKRALALDQGIGGQPCGICMAPKLKGRVHPGRSALAQVTVRDEPACWGPGSVARMVEMGAHSKAGK